MGVNSLPKTVTRQRRDCDLNPGHSATESSTLTTRLPSHPVSCIPLSPAFSTPLCVGLAYMLVYEGRTALHRAVEVHGQPSNTQPGTDINDSTDIIRMLVLHGADVNQPVYI